MESRNKVKRLVSMSPWAWFLAKIAARQVRVSRPKYIESAIRKQAELDGVDIEAARKAYESEE
jgi:hypothetical protein